MTYNLIHINHLYYVLYLCLAITLSVKTQAQQQVFLSHNWQQVGKQCAGCGSAFFMVHRNSMPNAMGRYESYVYVWSNSFDNSGNAVATYISRPRVYTMDFRGARSMFPVISMEYHLARPPCSSFNGWNLLFYLHSASPIQLYVLEFDYLGGF